MYASSLLTRSKPLRGQSSGDCRHRPQSMPRTVRNRKPRFQRGTGPLLFMVPVGEKKNLVMKSSAVSSCGSTTFSHFFLEFTNMYFGAIGISNGAQSPQPRPYARYGRLKPSVTSTSHVRVPASSWSISAAALYCVFFGDLRSLLHHGATWRTSIGMKSASRLTYSFDTAFGVNA